MLNSKELLLRWLERTEVSQRCLDRLYESLRSPITDLNEREGVGSVQDEMPSIRVQLPFSMEEGSCEAFGADAFSFEVFGLKDEVVQFGRRASELLRILAKAQQLEFAEKHRWIVDGVYLLPPAGLESHATVIPLCLGEFSDLSSEDIQGMINLLEEEKVILEAMEEETDEEKEDQQFLSC